MKKLHLILLVVPLALGVSKAMAASAELPYRGEGHRIVGADALQWTDVPSMAPGAQMTIIEGDLSQPEPFTMRLRMPANYELRPHTHPEFERVTVLSGTLHFAHGEQFDRERTTAMSPGSFAVMPPGDPMFGYTGDEETIIQLHGTGPWAIQYVNPEDDPRN
jgi:quercetin dioxygenase-like cupin family protein